MENISYVFDLVFLLRVKGGIMFGFNIGQVIMITLDEVLVVRNWERF